MLWSQIHQYVRVMDPLPHSTFYIHGSLNTDKCYCHQSINTILSNNRVLQKMDPNVARKVERGQPEQNERADPGHFFSQMHKFVQICESILFTDALSLNRMQGLMWIGSFHRCTKPK